MTDKDAMNAMLDRLEWKSREGPPPEGDLPYATHEGVFRVGDFEFRVSQLNTGQRVIDADDLERFFGALTVKVDDK